MPIYELKCSDPECEYTLCKLFDNDREFPTCPVCGEPLERMMSVFTPDVR